MGYSTADVIVPERYLSEHETETGECSAGHSVLLDRERWKAPGGSLRAQGATANWYCRRCCSGLTCKSGAHDLTDPDNVGKLGACRICKIDRQREFHRKLAEARAAVAKARAEFKASDTQKIINTTGPPPRWLMSGWPPRQVMEFSRCSGADPTLFDPIRLRAQDGQPQELVQTAESRLRKAAQICDGCPVRDLCRDWAEGRYSFFGEHRVAGGYYFGPRPGWQFANDSQQISEI